MVLVGVAITIAMASSPAAPPRLVALSDGDTIELLSYERSYSANIHPQDPAVSTLEYLAVAYASDLADATRDSSDARSVADLVCPVADSNHLTRVKVMPTKQSYFGLVKFHPNYWFEVRPGGHCRWLTTAP